MKTKQRMLIALPAKLLSNRRTALCTVSRYFSSIDLSQDALGKEAPIDSAAGDEQTPGITATKLKLPRPSLLKHRSAMLPSVSSWVGISRKTQGTPREAPPGSKVAVHLEAAGEKVSTSCWAKVENVPPLTSLDAMLSGVKTALDKEKERGIVDLDSPWDPAADDSVPFLSVDEGCDRVLKAHIILSPFARPSGWYLQFQNRSITHALITHSREKEVLCAHQRVRVNDYPTNKEEGPQHVYYDISDATIRVESCPDETTPFSLLNIFSRYDLKTSGQPVVEWSPSPEQEDISVPNTFLVHFADASWARAAMREKQAFMLHGKELRLAQYPKQVI